MSRGQKADAPFGSDYLHELNTNELLKGMYISNIDCAWSKTPFDMGGFHIRSTGDIEILKKYCNFVIIDMNKGVKPRQQRVDNLTILSSARKAVKAPVAIKVDREIYSVTHTIKKQIDKSLLHYEQLIKHLTEFGDQLRGGDVPLLNYLNHYVELMTDNILANPQTLIWLLNTDSSRSGQAVYSVRAAIWAAILGRETGLGKRDIQVLFLGTLLADAGMNFLPERLINMTGPFRKKEFRAYQRHVQLGMDLLNKYPELDGRIASIVRCHHERHDGRGFPRGLKSEQVPLFARYASLAFCFERLLRRQSTAESVSPVKAMAKLYKQRVLKFPEELAVEFIRILGTYPIGSLVELSNGEIAIVLEQTEGEKLAPKVALLSNHQKVKLGKPKQINLSSDKSKQEGLFIKSAVTARVAKSVGVDAADYTFAFYGLKVALGPLSLRL